MFLVLNPLCFSLDSVSMLSCSGSKNKENLLLKSLRYPLEVYSLPQCLLNYNHELAELNYILEDHSFVYI